MFHVKICGVRREAEIEAVGDAGADAIGLNFFPPSVRYVDPDDSHTGTLAKLASRRGLQVVGVVVNRPCDSIVEICDRLQLDAIQLHGDETSEAIAELQARSMIRIVRAVKLPAGTLQPEIIDAAVKPWHNLGCHPLLDVDSGSAHGGSGKSLDWDAIGLWAERFKHPWTLAGGLNPENVAEAIRRTRAESIDAASGVEQPRGTKCPARIAQFVAAAGH